MDGRGAPYLAAAADARLNGPVSASCGGGAARGQSLADSALAGGGLRDTSTLAAHDLATLIQELTVQMHDAATELHFELAARLRDEISDLKKELRQMTAATS